MVTNPIYESGEDFYEELPDNSLKLQMAQELPTAASITIAPDLPAPRQPSNGAAAAANKDLEADKLGLPRPHSLGGLSLSSQMGEDCYTVMSPAGTVTMIPRNQHSLTSLNNGSTWPMGSTL